MSETFTTEAPVDEQFCSWIMEKFGSRVESIERIVRAGKAEIRTVVRFSETEQDAA